MWTRIIVTGNVGVIERKKKGGTSLICKRVWPPAAIADRDWPGANPAHAGGHPSANHMAEWRHLIFAGGISMHYPQSVRKFFMVIRQRTQGGVKIWIGLKGPRLVKLRNIQIEQF